MTHHQYDKYKESEIEWIRSIPEHWKVVPLFSVMRERKVINDDNQITNVLSLSYGKIVPRDIESNYGLLPESFTTYQIVEPGNIILRLTDLQNDKRSLRVGLVKELGIITSAYFCLESVEALVPDYAYYLLHSYDIMKVFYNLGGGVRQSIKFNDIKRLHIVYPPLEEQCSIVSYLDQQTARLDELVEKKQRLIELLKEKRQALVTQVVTKGLNPNAAMKYSGIEWLGSLPKHWTVYPLKYLSTKITRGSNPEYVDESNIKVINQACVYWEGLKLENIKYHAETNPLKLKGLLSQGDVIVNSTGTGTLGRAAIFTVEDGTFIADSHITIIRCKNIYNEFLYYLLQTPIYQGYIFSALVTGSTNQIELSREGLRNLPIIYPPVEEQYKISFFLNKETKKIDRIINKIKLQINLLLEYRQALITAAVTGQIDVRNKSARVVDTITAGKE